MNKYSQIELIRKYWNRRARLDETKQIGFILRGNLAWESEIEDWIEYENGLRLKSNRFEPMRKHYNENPLRTYLQMYMNNYEIWGTMPITIDPKNAEFSKPIIQNTIHQMTLITNALSFVTSTSLEWVPASYGKMRHSSESYPLPKEEYYSWDCSAFRKSEEEGVTMNVSDGYIANIFIPFLDMIDKLPNEPLNFRTIIETAVSWHAYGNRFASGLFRFVAYWNSIELLGKWHYNNVGSKLTRKEKKDRVMRIVEKDITRKNCLKKIEECRSIVDPSVRNKITNFVKNLDNSEEMIKTLFLKKDNETKLSELTLLQIRNKIAHGSLSELDFEEVAELQNRLNDMYKISKKIIFQSIVQVDNII